MTLYCFLQQVQFEEPVFHNRLAQALVTSCFIHYAASVLPRLTV